MMIKECAFCEMPTAKVDRFGFCEDCSKAFKHLEVNEIEEIQNKIGFRKQTPDKEFLSGAA